MTIKLKIENYDQLPDGGPVEFSIRQKSLEIGRDEHRDWTLPDPSRFISGHHCDVRFENGAYWLHDVSRNGTLLNGQSQRMKSPYRLETGDRFQVGHYIISATISASEFDDDPYSDSPMAAPASSDNIWDIGEGVAAPVSRRDFVPPEKRGRREADFSEQFLDMPAMHAPAPSESASPFDTGESPFGRSESPFGEYDAGNQAPAGQQAAAPSAPAHGGPFATSQANTPQQPEVSVPPIPAPMPSARPAAPAPAAGHAPASAPVQYAPAPAAESAAVNAAPAGATSDSELLRALAEGASVPMAVFSARPPAEVAREIGAVLKTSVEELSGLLKARAAAKLLAKSSNRTMISADDNNPLKFIPSSSDVIEIMFTRNRPGYLGATESFSGAFEDLKKHEYATYAAMQKALAKLLDGLSPEAIESKLASSAFASKKSKAWEKFVEHWDAKTEAYENGMLDVFLAYFAEAYDEANRK